MVDDGWLGDMALEHPLHASVAGDDLRAAQALLDDGADVNGLDSDGWTPLMWARSDLVAKLLLAAGADAHFATTWGENVLMAVSRRADPATVACILDAGIDVNSSDEVGNVALGEAASAGNVATLVLLVERGAAIDAQTLSGETPLWAAARSGELAALEFLLGAGAARTRRARLGPWAGKTAADVADAEGHPEVAAALRRGERR
jgi:ankyrin repeat protein